MQKFLPADKHTGSSQYDVYSLGGWIAGDGRREDVWRRREREGGQKWEGGGSRKRRRGVKSDICGGDTMVKDKRATDGKRSSLIRVR